MAVNVYEGLFILHSNRYASDPAGVTAEVENLIVQAGGELLAKRLWDERRLAYPIGGQRKGTYWLAYVRIEGQQLSGLNRQLEINDKLLRHLFVKVDPRLVDALVAHATNPPASPSSPAATEPEAEAGNPETVGAGPAAADAEATSGADAPDSDSVEEVAAP